MDNLIPISDTGTERKNGNSMLKLRNVDGDITSCRWIYNLDLAQYTIYSFITHALIELLISIQIWWESRTQNFPNGDMNKHYEKREKDILLLSFIHKAIWDIIIILS
jgi:hypothetical protein